MSGMIQQEQQFNDVLLDKLVAHFGVTNIKKDGGYILRDGSLLNLNRSDLSNRQYHRAVAELLPKEMHGACDEITIVNLMTATGIIRYEARGRVHVATKPTQPQRRKLFEIMKYSEHSYRVLVSDTNAATIGDKNFKSPQAHELLQYFEGCFSGNQQQYRDDEFGISKEQDDIIFTFRPAQRQIGRYQPSTRTFTIMPEFEGSMALFKEKTAKLLQEESNVV
ncbi:hypothetical protein BIT28_10525 [Photobacterium proteolyticum]|uniref:Uncharacterized protein n=2 Tax=Photobacterium proteolyticum TaxID=1903952 RepID=A0A1Q9G6R3_9GAMM|nr:hypothetical protein BIT28_10525 [Photobacterium proteolyticum]